MSRVRPVSSPWRVRPVESTYRVRPVSFFLPSFVSVNSLLNRTPIYRATFARYNSSPAEFRRYSTHKILDHATGQYVAAWINLMKLPRGIAANIEPEQGRSSIGAMSAVFVDKDGEITDLVAGNGVGGDTVTFEMGFAEIEPNQYRKILTGLVSLGPTTTPDIAGYDITVQDPQKLVNRQLFNLAVSPLATDMALSSPAIVVVDSSDYDPSGHVWLDDEFIAYTSKSVGAPNELPVDDWNDIATDGNIFVAVSNDKIYRSADGKDWWQVLSAPSAVWESVTYKDGVWVAGNSGGAAPTRIAYSTDADTWTSVLPADIPSSTGLRRVRASSTIGKFIAIGFDLIMTSPDGRVWTQQTPPVTTMSWRDVAGNDTLGYFAICADAGIGARIAISDDGATWTSVALTGSEHDWKVILAVGAFFAVFATDTDDWVIGNDTLIWNSLGGTGFAHPWIAGMATTSGFIMVVATDGAVMANNGGFHLTTPISASSWSGLAEADGRIVVVSNAGTDTMMISDNDGVTWTDASATVLHKLLGLTRGVTMTDHATVRATHEAGIPVFEIIRRGPDHPMDILLDSYQNTDKTGLGISPVFIDTTQIAVVRAALGASIQMEFLITEKVNAKDWLEKEIFKPLGLYPRTTADGLLSLTRFQVPTVAVASFDHNDIVSQDDGTPILSWDANLASVMNSVTFEYDYDPITNQFKSTAEFVDQTSIDRYGLVPWTIQSKGLRLSLAGTEALIASIADVRIQRYKNGAPKVTMRTHLRRQLTEPGNIVGVTSALLPNRNTGLRGVVGELMEVINRIIQYETGYVDLVLLDTGWWL